MAIAPASGLAMLVAGHAATAVPGQFGRPRLWDLVTEWRIDPLLLVLLLAAAGGYVLYRVRARRMGIDWPVHRDVFFGVGVAFALWVTCGPAQFRATRIEWVWIAQLLALLLIVPFMMLAGRPATLARAVSGPSNPVDRIAESRVVRALGHPLVGPALVPVIFAVILFSGVGQAAASSPVAGWVLQALLLLIGLAIALPLVDSARPVTSMAIGLALGVGFLELILDVFPGIAMRLAGHPVIAYFATHTPGWTAGWLYEQHQAGGLLWIASEVLDLPFMILLAIRWVRVDAAEAARIDAELDAAQAGTAPAAVPGAAATPSAAGGAVAVAGTAAKAGTAAAGGAGTAPAARPPTQTTRPWFLDDQQLRDRYRF